MGFLDSYRKKIEMPSQDDALPGRGDAIPTASRHFVSGQPLKGPWPEGMKQVMFGMGCFWGLSGFSGRFQVFTQPPLVMQAESRRTRPMKKPVPV